jgi:chitinase
MGSTLTSLAYEKFSKADKAALKQNDSPAPAAQLDIGVSLSGFKEGDSTTRSTDPQAHQQVDPDHSGGTRIEFLVPTSTQTPSPTRAAWD